MNNILIYGAYCCLTYIYTHQEVQMFAAHMLNAENIIDCKVRTSYGLPYSRTWRCTRFCSGASSDLFEDVILELKIKISLNLLGKLKCEHLSFMFVNYTEP